MSVLSLPATGSLRQAIALCLGVQWRSLARLQESLVYSDSGLTTPASLLTHYIASRYTTCHDFRNLRLPCHGAGDLDPVTIYHVETSLRHFHLIQQCLLLLDEPGAFSNASAFVNSLLLSAASVSEYLDRSMLTSSADLCELIVRRVRVQSMLAGYIESGLLSSRLTFVLGMHRSGTSAFSGLLCSSGLDAPVDLMPPTSQNQKGYYESMSVFEVNEVFFGKLHSSWMATSPFASGWESQLACFEWLSSLLVVLSESFRDASRPVIKDPRFCLLFPALHVLIESNLLDVAILLPVRHPFEVAESLFSRDGLPFATSIRLWLHHVFSAELHTRSLPRMAYSYESLLSNPSFFLHAYASTFSLPEMSIASPQSDFVDPSLQHHDRACQLDLNHHLTALSSYECSIAEELYMCHLSLPANPEASIARIDRLYQDWKLAIG